MLPVIDWLFIINWALSIISLIATWANAKQRIWCFYLWIFTNIGYVIHDIVLYQDYARALLTTVQLWFCFVGIKEWSKIEKAQVGNKINVEDYNIMSDSNQVQVATEMAD